MRQPREPVFLLLPSNRPTETKSGILVTETSCVPKMAMLAQRLRAVKAPHEGEAVGYGSAFRGRAVESVAQ
jgi:hypothetical protein